MALLTTQEVHMKSFTATKFREGYDPDEVDDFLDEVIWTIGQLQTENTELKEKLEQAQNGVVSSEASAPAGDVDERVAQLQAQLDASQQRVAELEAAGQGEAPAAVEGDVADSGEIEALRAELAQAQQRIAELESSEPQQVEAAVAGEEEVSATGEPASATSMLALAQRVHDEYVRDGQQEGARLIDEAKAQGSQIVREAETKREDVLRDMEGKRDELHTRIEELKAFESEYRSNLRSHLEELLGRINNDEN